MSCCYHGLLCLYSHYNGDCDATMVSDIVCLSSLCNLCVECVFLPDFNASPHVRKKKKENGTCGLGRMRFYKLDDIINAVG